MANIDDITPALAQQNTVVFTTYRRDGMPQQSLVSAGRFEDGFAFTTRMRNAKYLNLRRDPRCAMMLIGAGYRGYAVLDGEADVRSPETAEPDQLRLDLRAVYQAAAGREHPDWAEYDAAMAEQGRAVILLRPARIVAQGLG
ncbi:MAG: TIGR03618 family F420-dependent PPOX class oxidoreductase [Chloroflexi bacterium]|nr:TIGR03618 family F420-dependent PPOX class oxidoreductase [Chloroflexota bacterium]